MSEFIDQQPLSIIGEKVLNLAKKYGASQAEVSLSRSLGQSVTVRQQQIETIENMQNQGASIVVYRNGRKAAVNCADFTDQALDKSVQNACDIARYTAVDKDFALADKENLSFNHPELELYFPTEITVPQLVAAAKSCEQAGLDESGITNTEGAANQTAQDVMFYANSHGFAGGFKTSGYSLNCAFIAGSGDNMQQSYEYTSSNRYDQLLKPEELGQAAAHKTLSKLNPQSLKTGSYPVIFHADVSSSLIGSFVRAINGMALYRGMTFLPDSLGKKIFPEFITIEEKPHLAGAPASVPFDSEGVITQDRTLVAAGVVKSYVLNSYSARKLNMQTTGNAGGTHNLLVSHDDLNLAELLTKMGRGLLITELMGQGVNTLTGDYSKAASGFWIENGTIEYPVDGITIAGNLLEMYHNINTIASDVDVRKSIRCGAMLINHMTVSGT